MTTFIDTLWIISFLGAFALMVKVGVLASATRRDICLMFLSGAVLLVSCLMTPAVGVFSAPVFGRMTVYLNTYLGAIGLLVSASLSFVGVLYYLLKFMGVGIVYPDTTPTEQLFLYRLHITYLIAVIFLTVITALLVGGFVVEVTAIGSR